MNNTVFEIQLYVVPILLIYVICFKGKTAFDIAKEYADPRVYYAVKNKIESLPKPKENKKQGGKKKNDKKKREKDPAVIFIL